MIETAVLVLLLACVPIVSLWLFTLYLERKEEQGYERIRKGFNPKPAVGNVSVNKKVIRPAPPISKPPEIKTAEQLQKEGKTNAPAASAS